MRTLLYLLISITLLSSCKSIDKMIESGDYEGAFRYGVDKLRGEKNKKYKHVKGLEKAYARLYKQDLRLIKRLQSERTIDAQYKVISIYENIQARQDYIEPLLPLVSKDGYVASITITDYTKHLAQEKEILYNIKLEFTEALYKEAVNLLTAAKAKSDKGLARKAYYSFRDTRQYFKNYKDVAIRIDEAYKLGQVNILVEPYSAGSNIAFTHSTDIIANINTSDMNSLWNKFHTSDYGKQIDYYTTIEIREIDPGQEREQINRFVESRLITDGTRPLKNHKGGVVKDTLGNIIYTENKINVTAEVVEVIREKRSSIRGRIVIVRKQDNTHYKTIPIEVNHIFDDYSCNFLGDRRALSQNTIDRLRHNCSPFPSNYEMIETAAHIFKQSAEEEIGRNIFPIYRNETSL